MSLIEILFNGIKWYLVALALVSIILVMLSVIFILSIMMFHSAWPSVVLLILVGILAWFIKNVYEF